MGRSPCCDESGLKKGPWTPEEDQKLIKHIQNHGHGSWRALPKLAGMYQILSFFFHSNNNRSKETKEKSLLHLTD